LLDLPQNDARLSFAELGRKLKLSSPAVAERMKRLEERGVIPACRTNPWSSVPLLEWSPTTTGCGYLSEVNTQPLRFLSSVHCR